MSLELDQLAEEAGAKEYKIVANLPYQISAVFNPMFRQLKGLTGGAVMVQKEVAMKVTAEPGEEGYGMLALAAVPSQVELASCWSRAIYAAAAGGFRGHRLPPLPARAGR